MNMIKKLKYRWILPVLAILLIQGCQIRPVQNENQSAKAGVLDLSGMDFSMEKVVPLDGEWEFYPNTLISPGGFDKRVQPTGFQQVPQNWTKYPGIGLPSKGSATYRLIVKTGGTTERFGIMTSGIYTEYRLWINDRQLAATGRFKGEETGYLKPELYDFTADDSQLEIILQVGNHIHAKGGIERSVILGPADSVRALYNQQAAIDLILFAVCFIAGIHHLILFYFRKKDKELIFFAGLCLIVSLRSLLSNMTLLMQVFPDMPFWIGSKLFTLTVPLGLLSLLFYSRSLFREDLPILYARVIAVLCGTYSGIVLVAPTYEFSLLFPYFTGVIMASLILFLYLAVTVLIRRKPESVFYLFGILFFTGGSCTDLLTFLSLADRGYVLPAAMAAFIASQSVLLAKRYAEANHNAEELSRNLQKTLDKVTNTETAFLNAQMKPHFLYNALNTIAQCCQSEPAEAEELILSLSKYLRGTLDFENLGGIVPLSKELDLVRAYASIEKARFDNVRIEYDLGDIPLDLQIPPLTLQPLVENAIKHGLRTRQGGGTVQIRLERGPGCISIIVQDNGCGIGEEHMEGLLASPKGSASIGLYNIHTRLTRLYGKGLTIRSSNGNGTRVSFEIPFMEGI